MKGLLSKVQATDAKLQKLTERVARNESNQRQKNMRIYGLPKDKVQGLAGETDTEKIKTALGEVFKQLEITDDVSKNIVDVGIDKTHYCADGAVIVAFVKRETKDFIEKKRSKLGINFKPYGQVISLNKDLTSEQLAEKKACGQRFKDLHGRKKAGTTLKRVDYNLISVNGAKPEHFTRVKLPS